MRLSDGRWQGLNGNQGDDDKSELRRASRRSRDTVRPSHALVDQAGLRSLWIWWIWHQLKSTRRWIWQTTIQWQTYSQQFMKGRSWRCASEEPDKTLAIMWKWIVSRRRHQWICQIITNDRWKTMATTMCVRCVRLWRTRWWLASRLAVSLVEKASQRKYWLVALVMQRRVCSPILKDVGIQAWSGMISACRSRSFIAWKGYYFKTWCHM